MARKEMTKQEKEARAEFLANETKEERFKRIATPRLQRAVDNINLVAKMASASTYEVSDDTIEKIINTMDSVFENLASSLKKEQTEKEKVDLN